MSATERADIPSNVTSKDHGYLNPFTDDEYPPSPPPLFSPSLLDSKQLDLSPPPYNDTPIPELAIDASFLTNAPVTLHMNGHYTSPNFEIYNASSGDQIIEVETDSSWISHEMYLADIRYGRRKSLFSVSRKDTTVSGEKDNWFYSATTHGRNGKRILEMDTRPDLFTNKSKQTRLKFRNVRATELDAVDLKIHPGSDTAEVLYRGDKIGEIQQTTKSKRPHIVLDIWFAGLDPLLFVVLALAMDDRAMSVRRRRKRALGREALGIGKGPGAGLAGAYAIAGGF